MSERGTTVIELLTAMGLLMVLVGAGMSMLTSSERRAPDENERALTIKAAQTQVDRLTRELRQAYRVHGTGYNYVEFEAALGGQQLRIHYDCTQPSQWAGLRACIRRQGPAGGALGAPVVLVDRVVNGIDTESGRVFTVDDPIAPRHVGVRIEIPAGGELTPGGYAHGVVLDDGVFLRNLGLT